MAFVDSTVGHGIASQDGVGQALGLGPVAGEAQPGGWAARLARHLPAMGVAVCLAAIVGSLLYAAISGTFLGVWTFWVAIGTGVVGLFGVLYLSAHHAARQAHVGIDHTVFTAAFEQSSDPMLITVGSRPILCNAAYRTVAERVGVWGVSDSPPALDRLFAGTHSDAAVAAIYRLVVAGVGAERFEAFDEDGSLRSYRIEVLPLTIPDVERAKIWRVRDITLSDAHRVRLADAPVGLAVLAADGTVVSANPTLSRWLGLSEDAQPEHLEDVVAEPAALLASAVEHARDPGRVLRVDTKLVASGDVSAPVVAQLRWEAADDGAPIGHLALYGHSNPARAVSAKPSVAGAAHKDAQPGDTFRAAPFAILEIDSRDLSEARILRGNPEFARLVGRAAEGEAIRDLFTALPDIGEEADHGAEGGADDPVPGVEAELRGAGGALPVTVYVVCNPRTDSRCWVYMVDVSRRAELQEQLVQSQKMQAIGQLAAGVAHDFNNLLQAIRLNTDELLGRHPIGDPSYIELQRINSDVMRAAALVKKLLAFSRKQTLQAEVLDVADTLSDVSVTLKQTLGERVALGIDHGRDLPPIKVDKSQLETVLINLCVNARDAMPGGGSIDIRSRAVDAQGLGLKGAHDNRAVCIEVQDTGEGISEATLAKIFEPFFTTKSQGKGTGLGLATVYGIVEQSGGHLEVDSEVGRGTTFRILLPAADPAARPAPAPEAANTAKAPANLAGQGTILLVEDEESVRTIAAKTLRKRGYRVVEAADGEEALEWLQEEAEPVDLLLSDVVMPGMGGPDLLRASRELLGEARIVFMSGYAKDDFSDLLAAEPDVTFLPKPFTLAELAAKVKGEIGLAA